MVRRAWASPGLVRRRGRRGSLPVSSPPTVLFAVLTAVPVAETDGESDKPGRPSKV